LTARVKLKLSFSSENEAKNQAKNQSAITGQYLGQIEKKIEMAQTNATHCFLSKNIIKMFFYLH